MNEASNQTATDELPDREAPEGTIEQVENEICSLAGKIAAATARFLTLLGEFDQRQGWAGDGIRSCAHWLSWRCGLSPVTAREHVRVARRLRELPETTQRFAAGELSYSKVRAICRVATPQTEGDLVHAGLHAPAGHLERLVRRLAHVDVPDEGDEPEYHPPESRESRQPAPEDLRVSWRWMDNGCLQITGMVSPEDGAALLAAAEATAAALHARAEEAAEAGQDGTSADGAHGANIRSIRSPNSGMFSSGVVAALSAAACEHLEQTEPSRLARAAEVVVHVDAELLTGLADETRSGGQDRATSQPAKPAARAHLDDGPALALSVIQRLACDGGIRLSTHGSDGRTLDLGRRRGPNGALLQALVRRDRGCAAPGCGRTRFLHAHHVVFWARGGGTTVDNMLLLCSGHHRLVHDDGDPQQIGIEALGRQRFMFWTKDGREILPAPRTTGDAQSLLDAYGKIADDAITPHWYGDSIDHDWFIRSFADRRSREVREQSWSLTGVGASKQSGDSAESPMAA